MIGNTHHRRPGLPPRSQRARKDPERKEKSEIGFGPQKSPSPLLKPLPNPPTWTPETVTEDFIMSEPDLGLIEQALGIQEKAA
jgi:hypothetical protein